MRYLYDFVINKDDALIEYDGIETEISVPYSINRILESAFGRGKAPKYKRIVLGEHVKTLDDEAFFNCCIDELIVSSSVINVSPKAFHNMNKFIDGRGIGKIICPADSPMIEISKSYGYVVEIRPETEINKLSEEIFNKYIAKRSMYALCCGQIIERHPIYTALHKYNLYDPSWEELREISINYQDFLCLNGNEDLIGEFRNMVIEQESRVYNKLLQEIANLLTEKELWALFAVTVGCMTPCVFITGINDWNNSGYIMMDRSLTPEFVRTKTPIYDCFNFLCEAGSDTIKKYNQMFEENVKPLSLYTFSLSDYKKMPASEHTRYMVGLYHECSIANDDRQRKVYNFLLIIILIFGRYYSRRVMMKKVKEKDWYKNLK